MSSEFKSFLKGLLIKEPSKRMSWPEILDHPFLRASNTDLDDEKRIRKKYNKWLRQVGQWNKDFEEFKSSKIDFFTSEIYTFDENGFTGYNSNRPGAKKKSKKGGKDRGKNLDNLSIDNSEKIFANLLKNKDPALNNFLEKFSELCSKMGQKGESSGSVKDFEKICLVLSKMYKEAPDLFGTKRKSVVLLIKKIKLFMEKLRDKKYLSLRLNCLKVCLQISELKDMSRFCINELAFAINTVDKSDIRACLGMLDVVGILFEKMQSNFTESVNLIQDLLSKKILHALFSSKKGIVNMDVLKLAKGKPNLCINRQGEN